MICISLAKTDYEKCAEVAETSEMIELRLDSLELDLMEINKLVSISNVSIAACRTGIIEPDVMTIRMEAAINAGVSYADIDINSPEAYIRRITSLSLAKGCGIIVSYHDFDKTPSKGELIEIINICMLINPAIIKIACLANNIGDCSRLLSLYSSNEVEKGPGTQLIAISMGEYGKISRPAATFLGAPFTYASYEEGKQTAPGQYDVATLSEIIKQIENG